MMRVLYIGDVHATVESLEDCERLDKRIAEVEAKEHPDAVVYLGDQYDNFALVRTECQKRVDSRAAKADANSPACALNQTFNCVSASSSRISVPNSHQDLRPSLEDQ